MTKPRQLFMFNKTLVCCAPKFKKKARVDVVQRSSAINPDQFAK